ncbi:hypothetical protein JAAARDRAFT_696959 [Jaapia argillacea MUCL 33604]|uniref:Uncharacterized protein n=1 Tax=Jaapia argillacea MUCL 33604 TaxID=933084 RepID=A0A067PIC1_9AGAM|nr:hypothetical protein JAAARDRAFT_696959 [Jaapia argillacea MUCL 33604]
MPNCPGCGQRYSQKRHLTQHRKTCRQVEENARQSFEAERIRLIDNSHKRRRLDPRVVHVSTVESGVRRSRRERRQTWKVRDALPDGPGTVRTVANRFGLSRLYRGRPTSVPDATLEANSYRVPTSAIAGSTPQRSIRQIITPYPNLNAWRYDHHFWMKGSKKSQMDQDSLLKDVLTRDDFDTRDLIGVNFKKINDQLKTGTPWSEEGGWREQSITIGIPTGKKPTQTSRCEDAAAQRRINRHEPLEDPPVEHAIEGVHFAIPGFHTRSICEVIIETASSDPAARDFHWHPFLLQHTPPGTNNPPETVHGEIYTSQAFRDLDQELQSSLPEPDCDLPRVVVALMFWSDATHLAQFGQSKAWPWYLYFGNQSKFPKIPDEIQDFIRDLKAGKAASKQLMTHCRREIFQAGWDILLDEEFMHAYVHGIIVDCIDGIRRRIYPRILTYSADYPEKMLIATLRDKGRCPCPRCLVTFDTIPSLGTPCDWEARDTDMRADSEARQQLVVNARKLIYKQGYVVTSEHVDALLKEQSLVPTRLLLLGFNIFAMLVVDLLHEFELGVFRQVFPFGSSTIRRFDANVSEKKKLAGHDYEDILQCAMPCFDGLFPEPHNVIIQDLLFVLGYWHFLAKLRMHTDSSLVVLDDTTTALGMELRRFESTTCRAFVTKETEAECAARGRAEAQQVARFGQAPTGVAQPAGRRQRQFNLRTIKTHALGDYVKTIKTYGTSDSYSTQPGELEHRRVKARNCRVSQADVIGGLVKLDALETTMHSMAHELQLAGVDIPGVPRQAILTPILQPEDHHHIAAEQGAKNRIYLPEWFADHPNDPALEDNCLYQHAIARINFTTYDVQRDEDIIHPRFDKPDIMVLTAANSGESPWAYARVIGIFHINVLQPPTLNARRIEFLWVRWFERDETHVSGVTMRRLEQLTFVQEGCQDAFGFVNPAHIIRGCHLIPSYCHGRTDTLLSPSLARDHEGDWKYHMVMRFVDRDMAMRHLGLGVGHVEGRAPVPETGILAPYSADELQSGLSVFDHDNLENEQPTARQLDPQEDEENEDIEQDLDGCYRGDDDLDEEGVLDSYGDF